MNLPLLVSITATKPEEYGDYFAWGEIEPYYSSLDPLTWNKGKDAGYAWTSYKWCKGDGKTLTKYCSNSASGYNGFTDGKTTLNPEDDAAYVYLGDKWRMPTKDELEELRRMCSWLWITKNGVEGFQVTGPNGNSIFLPAAGSRKDTNLNNEGRTAGFWSSTLYSASSKFAEDMVFNASSILPGQSDRYYGYSIRPVYIE